jgi:hypothetical protein
VLVLEREARYNGPVISPNHRVLLIKVTQDLGAEPDVARIYRAVRGWWRVGAQRRDGGNAAPQYVAAAYDGKVVAVFRIERWSGPNDEGRWAFRGRPDLELTAAYRGLDVRAYYPPGAQNPLRYVHCAPVRAETEASLADVREGAAEPPAETLAEISRRLDGEPLFHLMLAHRELFHSNLLGWFFENLPRPGLRLLRTLSREAPWHGPVKVFREWQHVDLIVEAPRLAPLIIENKVFAQPDEDQLARYGEIVRRAYADSACVLLSTNRPNWASNRVRLGGVEWTWLGYDRLADLIEAVLPAHDSYEVETMRRYVHVARGLAGMVEAVRITGPDDPFLLPNDVTVGVPGRLVASLAKARARHVANLLDEAVVDKANHGCHASGFTNGNALVEWHAPPLPCGCRPGWQQQGRDFRLFVATDLHLGRGPELRRARENHVEAQHVQWFDWSRVDELIGATEVACRPAGGGFNAYAPDFVYQNKPAPVITVDQMIKVTERLLGFAGLS